ADRDGYVMAVNAENGKVIWRTDLDVIISGGVGGTADYHVVATRDGEVIALNSTGEMVWRKKISSESLAPPAVDDDRVIVRGTDGSIVALAIEDGKQLWIYSRDVPALSLRGNSVPVMDQSRVYAGLDNGRLVALDIRDGHSVFDVAVATASGRSEIERLNDVDGDAVLDNNLLYIASYQGRIIATDVRRGQLLWTRKISTSTGVAAGTSSLFISDDRDHIWAMDRTNGATLWKQEKMQARQLTRPAVMDDYIIVGDYAGYLHWLSSFDGHFVARVYVDDDGILVPPLVKNNRVYVMTRDGNLVAYQLKPDS
ncbi:MAG: outer membrane protein YfgL, lipoprotein component of the protein assembly complex, partial [Pseudomonadota bacterium]|nr:outer membrane protein YfgL, lipoprotein component of the protein assembly complex [Pseudomonadota bacterium]